MLQTIILILLGLIVGWIALVLYFSIHPSYRRAERFSFPLLVVLVTVGTHACVLFPVFLEDISVWAYIVPAMIDGLLLSEALAARMWRGGQNEPIVAYLESEPELADVADGGVEAGPTHVPAQGIPVLNVLVEDVLRQFERFTSGSQQSSMLALAKDAPEAMVRDLESSFEIAR